MEGPKKKQKTTISAAMDDLCTHMCGNLILKAIQKDSNKNVLVSPLSFNAILNMIAAGATGKTLEQMLWFFGCNNVNDLKSRFSTMMNVASNNNDDGDGPVVSIVNGVWVDKRFPLKDAYQVFAKSICKAEARNVDFSTQADEIVAEVNLWAKNATKGLITDVLNPRDITPEDTICLLGNALYFKGAWNDCFDQDFTINMDFHLLNGEEVSARFMTDCKDYLYGSLDGSQVVKIPYRIGGGGDSRQFAMYIFLPDERDGLENLLEKANSNPSFFNQNFMVKRKRLDRFLIPKFKFSYANDQVGETLKQMGLTLPFSEDCQELTEMVHIDSKIPFYLSKIVQKATIQVTEEGTEAVAVTLGRLRGGGGIEPKTTFIADHPFMFMIREENSGLVLFTGAVLNPCSD